MIERRLLQRLLQVKPAKPPFQLGQLLVTPLEVGQPLATLSQVRRRRRRWELLGTFWRLLFAQGEGGSPGVDVVKLFYREILEKLDSPNMGVSKRRLF